MNIRRYVILLVLTFGVVIGTFAWTLAHDDRPVLGLDLQGGISIVLFPVEGSDLSSLDAAVDIIRNRVDALGIAEPEVQRQGDTIVVDLPGVQDREQAESLVGQTAELRFRVVQAVLPWDQPVPTTTTVDPNATTTTPPDSTATTAPADASATTTAPPADATTPTSGESLGASPIDTELIAAVRPAQTPESTDAPTTTAPGDDTATTTVPPVVTPEAGQTCADLVATRAQNTPESTVWLPGRPEDDGQPAFCYLVGPALMTGRNIDTAGSQYDPNTASYVTTIRFSNDDFVNLIARPLVGQEVAIELDGVIQSAPVINPGIEGREVVIQGDFTQGEAKDLALVLRYGSLPVQFDPEEQTVQSISPSLGKDQLHAGIVAGIIGISLVALYMLLYYRLLGMVVVIGLVLTGMIFFTLTTWLSANRGLTLTLAGVTGLIVSVGVTVDSYVVYFERLKDEIRTGKTVRSSLDTGFRRAFRTIVAADIVSLLGAAILYWLASGGVRGFAFFLGISTVIDLLLAYFYMYPLVALMALRPSLVRMKGIGIATGLDVPEVRA